jgi:hypothetical protein
MASGRIGSLCDSSPLHGPVQRVSAGYQVWSQGEFREFARYDDDPVHDGVLHRHRFTVNGPGEIDAMFPGVTLQSRGKRIVEDIRAHASAWAALLPIDDPAELAETARAEE